MWHWRQKDLTDVVSLRWATALQVSSHSHTVLQLKKKLVAHTGYLCVQTCTHRTWINDLNVSFDDRISTKSKSLWRFTSYKSLIKSNWLKNFDLSFSWFAYLNTDNRPSCFCVDSTASPTFLSSKVSTYKGLIKSSRGSKMIHLQPPKNPK